MSIVSLSCSNEDNNEQKNKKEEIKKSKIVYLTNEAKRNYQAISIIDTSYYFTSEYQKAFTGKTIVFNIDGWEYFDIFNKVGKTYLSITYNTNNKNFLVYALLECPDTLINYPQIKEANKIIFVARIDSVFRYVYSIDNKSIENVEDDDYKIYLGMEPTIILKGECKAIVNVNLSD